ncbi:MAG: hypothetical protein V4643_10765 [Bacteroidota bacterium]
MNSLTEQQYNSLIQGIYISILGVSLPCDCGEVAEFGMGEMGEVRDHARDIVQEWAEKESIALEFLN